MVSSTEERVVGAEGAGVAVEGTPGQDAAAAPQGEGVGEAQPRTPPTGETPPQPKLVPEEDLRKLQRTFNQRIDAQRNQLAVQEQALADLEAERQRMQQEILALKTKDLPEDEAERERLKHERDVLKTKVEQTERVVHRLQESDAFMRTMGAFVNGWPERGIEAYGKYGLTPADLEQCASPQDMHAVALRKKEEWQRQDLKKQADEVQKAKDDIAREKAALEAERQKRTGERTFDKGEPTSGGGGRPKRGTPEFWEYVKRVEAGEVVLS